MRSRSDLIHGLLLLALVLAVYSPTLSFGFVYDDHYYITRNRHMGNGLTLANVQWSFTKYYFSNWHPLTSLSYFLDTSLYGMEPWGYRLTNILLHIVNTGLVFVVGKELTRRNGLAWWMAAVFALHPLHLESVVWISERKDVLSILFGLWAILAYFKYAKNPSTWRYVAVCVLLTLSLLSKQTLITFPFLLLLFDAWPLNRLRLSEPGWHVRLGRLALEKLPLLAICIFFAIAAINAQKVGNSLSTGVTPSVSAINAVNALATYLRQSVWPTELCAYYPHPFHRVRFDAWVVATAVLLAVVCALALGSLFTRRRESTGYVATGWFWFLGTLMPMLGIIQLGSAAHADRYMYFPMIGLSLLVGMFFCRLADAATPWFRQVVTLIAYISVGAMAIASSQQATYWQNDVTLFRRALAVTRDNSNTRVNLADGLINQAKRLIEIDEPEHAHELLEEAREHALAAIRIKPRDTGYFNLITSLRMLGELDEAREQGLIAVEKFPNADGLWFCLGEVYHAIGDAPQAADCYAKAIEIRPNYVAAYNGMAVLVAAGNPVQAELLCRKAITFDPRHVDSHTNLGNALARQGRFDEAFREYRRALELDPDNKKIEENMAIADEMRRQQ